jgi:hypothetical protein
VKELRRLWLHVVLLLAAAVFAYVKSRPKTEEVPIAPGSVELWAGNIDEVTEVKFRDERRTVTLRTRKDDTGRWYLGSVEPAAPSAPAADDAGSPPASAPVEAVVFASVDQAETLVKALAPLRAKRALGQLGPDRLGAFGLEKPQGTLTVSFGDRTRELVVGAATPGDADRYAREPATGLAYVIDNAAVRDFSGGDSRLAERKLHGWGPAEVKAAVIAAGEKRRSLVRSGTEGRQFWADAATPTENDETANNWLQKVDRLRPMKFLEQKPDAASLVVRVEYQATGDKPIGFVEVHRRVVDAKDEYLIVTERTRLYSTVASSLGEQIADDLGSLLK